MLLKRIARYWPLILALPFTAWLLSPGPGNGSDTPPEKINLALRRTADRLLRAAGDSTSRIPAVEQAGGGVWRIRLERPFKYEELPTQLQASLDQYGIRQPFTVAVRRCEDHLIELGFHQADLADGQPAPCSGRVMAEGCHYIEIAFEEPAGTLYRRKAISWLVWIAFAGTAIGGWWLFRQRKAPILPSPAAGMEPDWMVFGHSQLDVAGQILICNGIQQQLTFRETKLLRLFASNPNLLLEREQIIHQVWADEGVLVGRSVDMFVSRLRKKLADDPSVRIVAVHGVGYRMEVKS